MVQRNIALPVVLIIQDAVALAKGAAAAILTRQPHRSAFQQEGAESERLAKSPVVGAACLPDLQAALEQDSLNLGEHAEVFRDRGQRLGDRIESLLGDRSGNRRVRVRWLENSGRSRKFMRLCLLGGSQLDLREGIVQLLKRFRFEGRSFLGGKRRERSNLFQKDFAGQRMILDPAVEVRLGKGGFVALVVPMTPVAIDVHDNVATELVAKFQCDLRHLHDRDRVFTVHMEDRRIDHFGDLRAIFTRARIGWQGREADLVIDDEMDGPASGIARELRHVESFGNHTLANKSRVSMDENRNHLFAVGGIVKHTLTCTGLSLDHRIDGFKMAGIGRQIDFHLISGGGLPNIAITEVIFHVAVSTNRVRRKIPLELIEDNVQRLVEDIGENVQPAAVRHAHDDLLNPTPLAVLDDRIESQDQGFAALKGEAFSAVLCMEEILKCLGFVELAGGYRGERPRRSAGKRHGFPVYKAPTCACAGFGCA